MFDVVVERQRGAVLGGLTQHHRAVAAVQEVRVATIARVDLDERAVAVATIGDIELGAATLGAFECQPGYGETGLRQRGGDGRRRRPAVRRTEQHQQRGTDEDTTRDRQEELRNAGAPSDGHHQTQCHERLVGCASPRSTQPRLAHRGGRGGPGDERERREASRRDPCAVVHGAGNATREVEQRVEQEEESSPACTAERDEQQASPPLLDHQHDHDDYRDENAGDLHDCQRQLAR